MRGKKAKALRGELIGILGRAPVKAGAKVPRYDGYGSGFQIVVKDEFRVWKRVKREEGK